MPIVTPILGADEAPSETVIYGVRSSLLIKNLFLSEAHESISVKAKSAPRSAKKSIGITSEVPTKLALSSVRVVDKNEYYAFRTVEIIQGEGFIILADLLQNQSIDDPTTGLGAGSFSSNALDAALVVNSGTGDHAIAIKSFNFQVPSGRLGSILNVVLADPTDVALIPNGANVKFQIVINVGGVDHPVTLMDNGKLQERNHNISYRGGHLDGPTDEVTFGALDVIADRFSLGPRIPITMYDPSRVKLDPPNTERDTAIRDANGRILLPVRVPVYGLDAYAIMVQAYCGGCGFAGMITNVPNYPVRRADFTIEGGWHDAALPVSAMFAPIYFVQGNALFIIDPDQVLPHGLTLSVHTLTLGDHKALDERIAFKPETNAVLLTYQYAVNDPGEDGGRQVREVYEETVEELGTYGEIGYTKTTTGKWTYEYFMGDAPSDVLAQYPKSVKVETQQTVAWATVSGGVASYVTYGVQMTHRETTEYGYEGELMVDMRKETEALVTSGPDGGDSELIVVETETTHVSWTEDPFSPGTKLQDKVYTDVKGLVVYQTDTETVFYAGSEIPDTTRPYPILLAQSSGILSADSIVGSELIPIKTIRESLHHIQDKQYNMSVVEIDHLNNTVKRSYSQAVTGSTSVDQYRSKSRTVLFTDGASEALIGPRIPLAINAYELPRLLAYNLAYRTLARLRDPLIQLPLTLPGVDFVVSRGTIIKGQRRDGSYTNNFFVTGYSIQGQNLGKPGEHRIFQTIEAVELLPTT